MAWNLPDAKKTPSRPASDSPRLPAATPAAGGAVQRARSPWTALNCFEDGRFHLSRFFGLMVVLLLLLYVLHNAGLLS